MSKAINTFTIKDPLIEPYYIQYDTMCFTVVKAVTSPKGRTRDIVVGYYSGLPGCLNSIAEDSVRNQNYESISDYINAQKQKLQTIKQLENYINQLQNDETESPI